MAKLIHIDENTTITEKEYIGIVLLAVVGAGTVMYKTVESGVKLTNAFLDALHKNKAKNIDQEGA